MEKRSILHMLDPTLYNSPFDINIAVDAGFDVIVPYNNVKLDSVRGLTQDAIFSRGPSGVKQTALFIGGRDIGLAIDMLKAAKRAMVPPFEISVFADPSGAFTTAAALVACVEQLLREKHNKTLANCRAVVFGGTGPVGIATGVIASLHGAQTLLTDHLSQHNAQDVAVQYSRMFGTKLTGVLAANDHDKIALIQETDIVFCTAKAGIQVLSQDILAHAEQLKVAGDVNAVPPLGIQGITLYDRGTPLLGATRVANAVGLGALAVGNVKYQLQHALLKLMRDSEQPVYLDFREAFTVARTLV